MKRQPRDERRRGIKIRLTDRDRELLHALARFRIARTGDLVELCFGGIRRDTAAVRIRRLFDSGYLDLRTGNPSEESLYTLGPRGRHVVTEEGGTVGSIPRGGLDHHLAIVSAWVSIANHGVPGLEIDLAHSDWELREGAGESGLVVTPDLFLVFRIADRKFAVAIEIDRGTESLRVLRDKIARYVELQASGDGLQGWCDFGLGIGVEGPGREARIQEIVESTWDGWWFTWSSEDALRAELRRMMEVARSPLTATPYGKGSESDVSLDRSVASRERRRGH